MMMRGRLFAAALCGIAASLLPTPVAAQEPAPADAASPAFLEFEYQNVLETVVTARYRGGSIYLPVGALFSELLIHHRVMPDSGTARGFYLDPEREYALDFAHGRGRVGERRFTIPDSAWIATELEIYALPAVFRAAFGLDFSVDFRRLALRLATPDTLPVVRRARRERRRRFAADRRLRAPAPLRYARDRRWIGGAVAQYSAATVSAAGRQSFRFQLGGGGELMGGGIQGSLAGSVTDRGLRLRRGGVSWRYFFDAGQRWIRRASVGDLFASGLRGRRFLGVQLSNEPIQPRGRLGTHTIYAATQPGWEVELYINHRLIETTRADAGGNFRFRIPLTYGGSRVRLVYYGPSGGRREEIRRIQVPFTFVPPGRVDYTVSIGREIDDGRAFALGEAAYGVTDRLTASAGVEYLDGASRAFVPFTGLTARVFDSQILGVEVAPGGFVRAAARSFLGTRGDVQLVYTDYARDPLRNPGEREWRLHLIGFLPTDPAGLPLDLRLNGSAVDYRSGQRRYRLNLDILTDYRGLRPSIGYELMGLQIERAARSFTHRLTAGLLYYVSEVPEPLAVARGTLLHGSTSYALDRSRFRDIRFRASKSVLRYGRLSLGVAHDFIRQATELELALRLHLPFTRSYTSIRHTPDGTVVVERVRGSIAFDPRTGDWVFSEREWLGGAAAALRAFVDRNGNARYDAGENVIERAKFRFRHPTPARRFPSGIVRTADLQPHHRYSVDIVESSIPNPLWIPVYDSFSFIADPNRYKPIDIPFYVAGVVSGSVSRRVAGEPYPVSGLRIHIEQTDGDYSATLPTFSDGSFYKVGLPPGEYRATIDPEQLDILGAVSDPAVHTFRVEATEMGDFVEGIEFVLEPRTEKR